MTDDEQDTGFSEAQWLSTEEAAKTLRVGVSSIKRWVDQGVLRAIRTPGGHRRVARDEVLKLLQTKAVALPAPAGSHKIPPPNEIEQWAKLFCANTPQALLLEKLQTKKNELGSWSETCEVLGEVLVLLGQQWTFGQLSIVDEHSASDRMERVLHSIAASVSCDPEAPVALLLTAPGDDHTLGLLLVEVALREAGLNTRWSGKNTPADQVRQLVQSGAVQLVAISASAASTNREMLQGFAEAVAATCKEFGVTLLLGGSGVWPDHLSGVSRVHHIRDLAAMSSAWVRRRGASK